MLDNAADALPLLRAWVHACWVVGASMQQDHSALWCGFEVLHHALATAGMTFTAVCGATGPLSLSTQTHTVAVVK